MSRYRSSRALTAWFLVVVVTIFGLDANSNGQQSSDRETIAAAVDSFNAALSARDIGAIERLWAHESYVIVISPRDQSFSFGWDAVKKHWQDVFDFWSYLRVSLNEKPQVHIHDGVAWAYSVANAEGQIKTGESLAFSTMVTDILEKRGDTWFMVSHHASRKPE